VGDTIHISQDTVIDGDFKPTAETSTASKSFGRVYLELAEGLHADHYLIFYPPNSDMENSKIVCFLESFYFLLNSVF
jgi:hypothetical protein